MGIDRSVLMSSYRPSSPHPGVVVPLGATIPITWKTKEVMSDINDLVRLFARTEGSMHQKAPPLRIVLTVAISILLLVSGFGAFAAQAATPQPTVTFVGQGDFETLFAFSTSPTIGASTSCVATCKDRGVLNNSTVDVTNVPTIRATGTDFGAMHSPFTNQRSVVNLTDIPRVSEFGQIDGSMQMPATYIVAPAFYLRE